MLMIIYTKFDNFQTLLIFPPELIMYIHYLEYPNHTNAAT